MARECGPPSWVLRIGAEFAQSSFFDRKSKRHLGGPHSRAMTALIATPTRHHPSQFTVTATGAEGMPLATTTSVLAPVSVALETSKWVDTGALPVATAIVLWSCVRA